MILLNESKIKYEKLNSLLESVLCDITLSSQVNVIVDLKEVIRKVFRNGIPEGASRRNLIEEISADVINIISHYRNYFYKNGKYTSFYFIYSKTECAEILKNYNSYKADYYMKYFKSEENKDIIDIVQRVITICEKVINYTPNSYFIDSSKLDELVYVKYIIEKSNTNELNVILSNDPIMYQLLNKHTIALSLKGIKSELITESNAVGVILKNEEEHCSCKMIPLILAMAGHKKFSIKNVPGVAMVRAVNIIESLIAADLLIDADSVELPIKISELDVDDKLHKLIIRNIDLISSNYNLIRNDQLYFSNINLIPSAFVVKPINISKQTFLDLNAKLFTTHPIQLDMLLKGEKL